MNHLSYDYFGNVVSQSNSSFKSRYGFTGRELDSEIGLYFYRGRYYDGKVGRFLSEDPIGFNGGDSNLYRYVGNSPLDHTDPFGRSSKELTALLSIAQPRNGNLKEDTIYYYPKSPDYSIALTHATTWFYLITERDSRSADDTFANGAWILVGKLKNAPGKGALRPFGTKSETAAPTIQLQKNRSTGEWHGTEINGIVTKATEVKFLFDENGDNSVGMFCPVLKPPIEPELVEGRPSTPLPAPPPPLPPAPSPPWNIPIIPLPPVPQFPRIPNFWPDRLF